MVKTKNIVVVKFGGSLMDDVSIEKKILKHICGFAKENAVVVVHGGGKKITDALSKSKIETKFINGLRYTDAKSIKIVEKVLEEIQDELVKKLKSAIAIKKAIVGTRIKQLGYVGKFASARTSETRKCLSQNKIVVLSSVGKTKNGRILNFNADEAASGVASAIKANKLIFFTDVKGVLDNNKKTIPVIKIENIENLVTKKIIVGGMIPKIHGCARAVKNGVGEVDIVNVGLEGTRIVMEGRG